MEFPARARSVDSGAGGRAFSTPIGWLDTPLRSPCPRFATHTEGRDCAAHRIDAGAQAENRICGAKGASSHGGMIHLVDDNLRRDDFVASRGTLENYVFR